jgi:predicted nuclease with RNAse H fold
MLSGRTLLSFLGIALSSSTKRLSTYALLDDQGIIEYLEQFSTFDDLITLMESCNPSMVGIDAPLTLPMGLCCLDEDHSCSPTLGQKGRTAERELARMHIGCFFTTKRSIIKPLIYRGRKLYEYLTDRGYQVLETYPYATKVILFGDKMPPKNSTKGLVFLKDKLSQMIEGMDPYLDGLNHDGCDAILSGYTVWLHGNERTDLLGIPEEGYIVVPRLLGKSLD